jgi:hypothetical protein
MVEAAQVYHPKVVHAIRALARYYAREETKRIIRARGEKIGAYLPKDIYRMGDELLEECWEEFSAKAEASGLVDEVRKECERKEQRRLERKSEYLRKKETLAACVLPLNVSHAQNGAAR